VKVATKVSETLHSDTVMRKERRKCCVDCICSVYIDVIAQQ